MKNTIFKLMLIVTFLTLFNFPLKSDEKNTQTRPNVCKYEFVDEIVFRDNEIIPDMHVMASSTRVKALMIGDKVYCVDEYQCPIWGDNEFHKRNFKVLLYDIAKDEWSVALDTPAFLLRHHTSMFNYNGNALIFGGWIDIWGYGGLNLYKTFNDGFILDTKTNEIKALPTENAPTPRAYYSAVFNGEELIIFGGIDKDMKVLNDGAIFNVKTWKWRKLTNGGLFGSLAFQHAVWLPENPKWKHSNCMLVWGGTDQIEAIYKKKLPYYNASGILEKEKLVFDEYKIIPKDMIAVYYPDIDKWDIIQSMYYEREKEWHELQYRPGRKNSEIALSGDYAVNWGGINEDDDWVYYGDLLDLRTNEVKNMTTENQPAARSEFELIPFEEADKNGKICAKVLVAFGGQYIRGMCANGWYAHSSSVFNLDTMTWEKKLFCPFSNFVRSKHNYFAFEGNRIFHHCNKSVIYNVADDSVDVRYGNNFKSTHHYNSLQYFGKHEYSDKSNSEFVDYFYWQRNDTAWLSELGNYQIYKVTLPTNSTTRKEKLKFQRVGLPKQTRNRIFTRFYKKGKFSLAFDKISLYFSEEKELPPCKSCGFVLNQETGEIYDIPVYENSLYRISASVVVADEKLFIIGGKHEDAGYINDFSWDNTDRLIKDKPTKELDYSDRKAKCRMPLAQRKKLYPDYPYLNDMYIFDLNKKTWSRQVFPENFKARMNAYITADESKVFMCGGYRDIVQDNIAPENIDRSDMDQSYLRYHPDYYLVTDGFTYDIATNTFKSINETVKLTDGFIWGVMGQHGYSQYKVFNDEIIEINGDYDDEDETQNYLLKKYNPETKNWERIKTPDEFIEKFNIDTKIINTQNELLFVFEDELHAESYEFYRLTNDLEFIEDTTFHDAFVEFDKKLKENGKGYFDVNAILTDTGVICNFALTENYLSKSTHKFNTRGFKLDFNTLQVTEIQGFPKDGYSFDDNGKLAVQSYEIGYEDIYDEDRKIYGSDASEIMRFYMASE